jgi:hypothetical protein
MTGCHRANRMRQAAHVRYRSLASQERTASEPPPAAPTIFYYQIRAGNLGSRRAFLLACSTT